MNTQRELTFGEKAVGLTLNPGFNPAVDGCKRTFAAVIDQMNDLRAAAAAAVVTAQRQQIQQRLQQQSQISSPAHDDLQDPATQNMGPVDSSSYKWVAAYRRAGHKRLPRSLRAFGWRLLWGWLC